MPDFDVIGMGALNVDRVYSVPRVIIDGAQIVGDAVAEAGGCSANAAYALAKLGLRCGAVGAVGDDADAEIVLGSFAEVGVDTSRVARKAGASTGSALIFADEEGNRAMYIRSGANAQFGPEDVDASYVASARLLLLSSFNGDIPLAVQSSAVEALPETTLVGLAIDGLYARRGLEALAGIVGRSVVLFSNGDELGELTGLELPAAAQAILGLGCRTVVVTFGRGVARRPWMAAAESIGEAALRHAPEADPPLAEAQGEELPIVCWVASGEGQWVLPALPTHAGPIVDATGAGDAFAAGFLWGFLAGEPLPRCASLGHVAAGFCLTSMGCRVGLPTREALLGRHARYFR